MHDDYIHSTTKQFEYYKKLGERTFAQLTEDQLLSRYNEECNSIAIIVNHLWGNMLSRWTNFLTEDGEKEWRDRDQEFENVINNRADLVNKWEEGWNCVFSALNQINTKNFHTPIFIRNQKHTIFEACNRQMMHYAYHIGQIVMIGKMIKGKDWKSLSVPRGKSQRFNSMKSSRGKHGGHFTDDFK